MIIALLLSMLACMAYYVFLVPSGTVLSEGLLLGFIIALAWKNMRYSIYKNSLLLPMLVSGILVKVTGSIIDKNSIDLSVFLSQILLSAAGIAVAGGSFLVIAIIFEKIIGREALGGGDIKIMGCVGAFVGPHVYMLLPLWCICGAAFGVIFSLMCAHYNIIKKGSIPSAPIHFTAVMVFLMVYHRLFSIPLIGLCLVVLLFGSYVVMKSSLKYLYHNNIQ